MHGQPRTSLVLLPLGRHYPCQTVLNKGTAMMLTRIAFVANYSPMRFELYHTSAILSTIIYLLFVNYLIKFVHCDR